MQIILLGTGTPILDPTRQQSALLIDIDGVKLLFDAGRGVTSQMMRVGTEPQRVDALFITHHHYDHISDLGEFLLSAWHNGRTAPLPVYGPPGTTAIVIALFDQVFARDIAFARFTDPEGPHIKEIVQVQDIAAGLVCATASYRVLADDVDHGNSLGLSHEQWPCLGYRIEAAGQAVAISGDTVACAGLDRLAHGADCLVQCCYLAEAEITTPASVRLSTHIIASAGQAGRIAAHNQVKKLVLTHIRPKSDALLQSLLEDVRHSYQGEVVLGADLMVIDL